MHTFHKVAREYMRLNLDAFVRAVVYVAITITILDIIHRQVFYFISKTGFCFRHQVAGILRRQRIALSIDAQLSRFHQKTNMLSFK
jgi:hypothetical protein